MASTVRLKNLSWLLPVMMGNLVGVYDSDSDNKNVFDEGIDNKVKATPKTTINDKVV